MSIHPNTLKTTLGPRGKMIAGSKSIYHYQHKGDLICFNARVCTKENGEIWNGDINITLEEANLVKLAKRIKKRVYVVYESNGHKDKIDLSRALYSTDGKTFTFPDYYKRDAKGLLKEFEDLTPHGFTSKIEFQDIAKFKVEKKKDQSPLDVFYHYVRKKKGIAKKDFSKMDISKIWITRQDYTILEYLVREWAKVTNRHMHPVKLDQSVGMAMFSYGPCTLADTDNWAKDGYIYLKSDNIFKDKE